MNLRRYLFAKSALCALLILLTADAWSNKLFAQFGTAKQGDRIDAVVGVVGKYPIYKSTIDARLQLILLQHNISSLPDDSMMSLRNQILQGEIDNKVLVAKADQDSIVVSETDIDEAIDRQIGMMVRQVGSTEALEKQFGRTIAEIKANPEYRQKARETLLAEKERAAAFPSSQNISRRDVEQFFRLYKDSLPQIPAEVQLSTIIQYVKPHVHQKEQTRAFAESLVDSLKNGADFATLARRYSQHISAKDGGDLISFYPRGTFFPEYEEVAFNLKPGQVSDVVYVESENAYYIIKLIERRGEEIHVAEIKIKTDVSASDEEVVRNEILRLRDSAMQGKDFAKLAQAHSDDQETRTSGGDLGTIRVDDLHAEQRDVIDSLTPGEISMPLHIQIAKSTPGFQIVKLIRKLPAHKASLETDYRDIEAYALQWKGTKDMMDYLARARSEVYVSVRDLKDFY